ncbi:MAG: carboxypeptidase-like regulatory domain-containing protein [Bacteroidales bacterium]|nr:carboxypeptidase-like regulatory domain-containing protein [Bacteroidales bacterium]
MIFGKVVDAKNNPVENANILNLSNKAGTISNSNGYFYITASDFPVNLTISRIGFEKSNLTITKKAFEGIETYVVIHLKKKTYELEEVKISSEKPEVIITKQANWIILDFKIADEKLLVLLQKGPNRKLRIFNIDTLSYFEVDVPIKGNELYQDCMGNVHLFTEESIYQMQTDFSDSTISLYATYSKEKFNNSLENCVGYINENFIFKSLLNHNQKITYWYLKDKKKSKLYDIYDKNRELFAQNFLDKRNELIEKHGHIDEMGEVTIGSLRIKRKIKLLKWSYQYIGMVPAYNPLFISFDTILVFDNLQQRIVFFDSAFSFQKEVPILYQTRNNKRIFQDKATGKFYIESLSLKVLSIK